MEPKKLDGKITSINLKDRATTLTCEIAYIDEKIDFNSILYLFSENRNVKHYFKVESIFFERKIIITAKNIGFYNRLERELVNDGNAITYLFNLIGEPMYIETEESALKKIYEEQGYI